MGDFNFHIKELSKRLRKEGLRQSIPEGLETHSRGNQLDQIFSNAETIEQELDQLKLADHKLQQAKLKIKFHENDLKMTDREKTIRISDVRKQCWKTFIEEGRELKQEELEQPVRKCFEDKLEKQSKTKNWYQQPPQLAVRNNITSNNIFYLDTKEQWKEAIRDMEHCLGRNYLKGFFYLVKRLTKNKKSAQPIKGLTIKDERVQTGEQTLKVVLEYYNQLFKDDRNQDERQVLAKQSDTAMIKQPISQEFCDEADVARSISECIFNKAIGHDGFDGKMLVKNEKLKRVITTKIIWINNGVFPKYIKEGRLVLLGKNQFGSILKQATLDLLW
ncbi:hypothetical protein OXYTRIMIC_712 [Oxytricha trifallax]|uniref:Uncharacterized protein n=1 Tax=Oxytricha trifallax TaxID=1172189 RepID=A0A073HZQ0_9SPIT|nr:hypothetical protein OXYTRIMIC_712 [Oxytricha trifallax]